MNFKFAPIAQWLEQIPLKDKVQGSNPCGGTIFKYELMISTPFSTPFLYHYLSLLRQ